MRELYEIILGLIGKINILPVGVVSPAEEKPPTEEEPTTEPTNQEE